MNNLKLLNDMTLAVKYKESFYQNMLGYTDYSRLGKPLLHDIPPPGLTPVAYYNSILIGGIACRVEPRDDEAMTLYILTFNVLEPYRKYKIGTPPNSITFLDVLMILGSQMMDEVLRLLREKDEDITSIYLHVQDGNEAALNFYKKYKFEVVQHIPDFYRVEPTGCSYLRRAWKGDYKFVLKEPTKMEEVKEVEESK